MEEPLPTPFERRTLPFDLPPEQRCAAFQAAVAESVGDRTRLDVADRVAGIAWERAEFVAPDPSVTLTDGTHPTVSVDSYRVQSEPQESP